MRVPSGDQRGVPLSEPNEVNGTVFEPSLSQTQISPLPERPDAKAILRPSGENCGNTSLRVEEMKFIGELVFSCGPVT
jgi:hypothetical protein